jgi:hypothetical protein
MDHPEEDFVSSQPHLYLDLARSWRMELRMPAGEIQPSHHQDRQTF